MNWLGNGSISRRHYIVYTRHELFPIGRVNGSAATTELARYHKTTDLQGGTDSEDVRLVDQLDFDGDGTDEIVVEVWGYESEEFAIYQCSDGSWTQVHLGGQAGCQLSQNTRN